MKKVVKKVTSKKPMMKTGGVKKTLKKYQGNNSGSQVTVPVNSPQGVMAAQKAQQQNVAISNLVGTENPYTGRPLTTRQDATNYYNRSKEIGKMQQQNPNLGITSNKGYPALTDQQQKELRMAWEKQNKRVAPTNAKFAPSSYENYLNKSGTYTIGFAPKEPVVPMQKKGGTTKMKKGGAVAKKVLPKAKEGGDKKWIQKAINPKHKGYCTPMTKPTCTPKRKALAKTLKKMAKNR